jgi:hypothetical protein
MNKHTLGPWDAAIDLQVRARGCVVGRIFSQPNGIDRANATLIAAAPDLLAALRECVDFCKGHRENDAKRARYERVIAAIAKAEGQQ